ncbi:hypothetical protein ACFE6N_22915 [Pedobacter sp. BG31]
MTAYNFDRSKTLNADLIDTTTIYDIKFGKAIFDRMDLLTY